MLLHGCWRSSKIRKFQSCRTWKRKKEMAVYVPSWSLLLEEQNSPKCKNPPLGAKSFSPTSCSWWDEVALKRFAGTSALWNTHPKTLTLNFSLEISCCSFFALSSRRTRGIILLFFASVLVERENDRTWVLLAVVSMDSQQDQNAPPAAAADEKAFKLTAFSDEAHDSTFHFQILHLTDQVGTSLSVRLRLSVCLS